MIDMNIVSNNALKLWLKDTNKLIFKISKKMEILDSNDAFEKYKHKFNLLSQLITYTHIMAFKNKVDLLSAENPLIRFTSNFSFDKEDVEDIPITYNIVMEYINDDNIIVLADPQPYLSHEDAKAYFSMVNDFSTMNRDLKKSTLMLEEKENMLQKLNENLEQRVIKEVEKNKHKQQIIFQQSKMASMGEMIENIAHQWRQPLSIISTSAGGLQFKNELDILDEDDIETTMNTINNSVQHLSQTIDYFRDFFKEKKNKDKFLLIDTFEKTLKLVHSQFRNNDIVIVKSIENITLYGLENELIQVFTNILNNARDELITKDKQDRLIIIDSYLKDNEIIILIKDNAGGIPIDILDNIFESHFTTKQDTNGTGIGLYMSKMIIEEHMKGNIMASNIEFSHENKSYQGAEFRISLPLDMETNQ